jgi:hypothetical protein
MKVKIKAMLVLVLVISGVVFAPVDTRCYDQVQKS